jgi:spore germination protein KA
LFFNKFFKAPKKVLPIDRSSSRVVESREIKNSVDENLQIIGKAIGNPDDLVIHRIEENGDLFAAVIYFESLVDSNLLGQHVIKPINKLIRGGNGAIPQNQLNSILTAAKLVEMNVLHQAIDRLLAGYAIILLNRFNTIYGVLLPGFARRKIEEAPTEKGIKGPREGFTETITDNIGLIRRYIKDPNLRLEKILIGERTKTEVAVIYLNDVANPDIVQEVHERLEAIEIDGILESGYIAEMISDRRITPFPLVQETEKPDRVVGAILEGRVAILVDRSSFNIVVPVTSNEFYQTSEDFYFNWMTATGLRIIRAIGTIFAVVLPGLYISIISVNPELMPPSLIQLEGSARAQVPFPAVLEMVLTFLAFEILREASVRFPSSLNMILGVGGGIVMGLAAINAGLVSGISVALVVFCILAAFTTSNPAKEQAWRWVRYFLFFAGASFGFMGVIAAGVVVLAHMAGLKSFGVSYLAPWAPPIAVDIVDAPVRLPWWLSFRRPLTFRPQQEDRLDVRERTSNEGKDDNEC